MMKPSEHGNGDDTCRIGPPPEHSRSRHALFEPLMRARGVEIAKAILLENLTEMPFAENNNVVEALAPDAAEKPLANRIHERSLDRRSSNADTGALCGTVKVGAELVIVVANDELGPDAEGRGLPHLLCRPLR